jgi:hypothetical protein
MVEGNRQLDHPQAGTQMASRHRHRVDRLLAQLGRQLDEAGAPEAAQVAGHVNLIEKR